jgi:hypothetical protein
MIEGTMSFGIIAVGYSPYVSYDYLAGLGPRGNQPDHLTRQPFFHYGLTVITLSIN